MFVIKLGEESLKSSENIIYLAEIISRFKGEKCMVVVSAMYEVVDLLISIFQNCQTGQLRKAEKEIEKLYKSHKKVLTDLHLNPENHRITYRDLEGLLERLYMNLCKKTKFTEGSYDFVISFGEKFSSLLVNAALIEANIKAIQVDGSQIIVATSNYGNAKAFVGTTKEKIKDLLLPLVDKNIVPVVTGSFGLTKKGNIAILGSSGMNCSASIIAQTFNAKEIRV